MIDPSEPRFKIADNPAMFENLLMTADQIEADLELRDREADGLRETAAEFDGLAGGRAIAVAFRGIAREVGMHVEAMRAQIRALQTACEEHPSRHQNPDAPAVMH